MKLENWLKLTAECKWEIIESLTLKLNEAGSLNYQIFIVKQGDDTDKVMLLKDDGAEVILSRKDSGEIISFAYAVTLDIFTDINDHCRLEAG